MNADKCGDTTFTQLRREGAVCMYRRDRVSNGELHSFEVFVTKTVKAGAPLPGGGTVAEDYEQYPGASSFGRSAWSTNAEQRANKIFDGLIKKAVAAVEHETEEIETVPVARVAKGEVTLKLPDKPFTQKELAAFNGLDNYKEVYSDLQKMLSNKTLKVVGERTAGRGKAAKLFGPA